MVAEIRHKLALGALAVAAMAYVGGNYGSSPGGAGPSLASLLDGLLGDVIAGLGETSAPAAPPFPHVTAFAHTPSNATLDVAWSAGPKTFRL